VRALLQFITAVDWEEDEEAREAVSLLPKWAGIDMEDALRLLSPDFKPRAGESLKRGRGRPAGRVTAPAR